MVIQNKDIFIVIYIIRWKDTEAIYAFMKLIRSLNLERYWIKLQSM